jgi:hypothetical protein
MRTMTLQMIDEIIQQNKKEANLILRVTTQTKGRKKRTRTRTTGEQEALNQIAIRRWQKALEKGKVKKLGTNTWYYDYTD